MNNKDKKINPNISNNDDTRPIPNVPRAPLGFVPPISTPITRGFDDGSKAKIASIIINAEGVKLQELNLLPDGLVMALVSYDVYCYIIDNPDAEGKDIVNYLKWSLYHHLRGRRAGLLNKVIPLATKEYEVQSQNEGYTPGYG